MLDYEDDFYIPQSQSSTAALFQKKDTTRLTKGEKRRRNKESEQENTLKKLSLKHISPKTANQQKTFDHYRNDKNLLLHGVAGTGKTFISLYLALNEILYKLSDRKKIIVVRSVVATRDMGFLPGDSKEKSKVYEQPYSAICNELFLPRMGMYEFFKSSGMIEFVTTSFIRGITLKDAIVIVDECQNMTYHELDSIITRLGENCKVIFSGDFRQTDLVREKEKSGLLTFMNVLRKMNAFESVEFTKDDIVRSRLVKEYILCKLEQGIT